MMRVARCKAVSDGRIGRFADPGGSERGTDGFGTQLQVVDLEEAEKHVTVRNEFAEQEPHSGAGGTELQPTQAMRSFSLVIAMLGDERL